MSTIFSAFMASDRTAEISTKKEVPTEITSDEGNADTVIGTGGNEFGYGYISADTSNRNKRSERF